VPRLLTETMSIINGANVRMKKSNEVLKSHWSRFAKFSLVGVLNTFIDVALFSVLFYVFKLNPFVANLFSFLGAAFNSYLLNGSLTFGDRKHSFSRRSGILNFILFSGLGFVLSTVSIILTRSRFDPLVGKMLGMIINVILGYTILNLIIFPDRQNITEV
jgi:putative flippase GtrA